MSKPISVSLDRSMVVPPGHVVRTAWVSVDDIVMACRERMAVGDVAVAYRRQVHLGECSAWPCPVGYWEGGRYHLTDGRHEFVAALMFGRAEMLVAWVEAQEIGPDGVGPEGSC